MGLGVGLRPARVVVQGYRGVRLGLKVQIVQVGHQEFGHMVEIEALLSHVHDVIVEVDTRRAPHHHLLWVELLEVGGGGGGNGSGRVFVATLEVLDATTVRLAANSGKVNTHQLEDVLDFVRTSELSLEKSSVLGIIQSSIKRVSMPESVVIRCPNTDYELKCDKVKLEIVFVNILSNALDSINDEGKIQIRMNGLDRFLRIEFEDSGPGIDKHVISKVFDPLFTLKQKGTGLGLASCKNIIEQHNGTISVTNNPTIFSIKLSKNL